MAKVAHVAYISEGEVVIEASLACPVTNSLLNLFSRSRVDFGTTACFFLANFFNWLLVTCLDLLQETLLFSLGSLVWRHSQVLWHALRVVRGLWLLASVALLSSFEVVVLALAALPSTVRELEVRDWLGLLDWLLRDERLDGVQIEGLMERLDTSSRSGNLGKLIHLLDTWHLSLHLQLLQRWEVYLRSHVWEVLLGSAGVLLKGLVRVVVTL